MMACLTLLGRQRHHRDGVRCLYPSLGAGVLSRVSVLQMVGGGWQLGRSMLTMSSYKKLTQTTPSARQDIKAVAKVDDAIWYYGHLVISSLAVVLSLGVVIIGGIMILLLNLDPLQGVAAFSIVSLQTSVRGFFFAN